MIRTNLVPPNQIIEDYLFVRNLNVLREGVKSYERAYKDIIYTVPPESSTPTERFERLFVAEKILKDKEILMDYLNYEDKNLVYIEQRKNREKSDLRENDPTL
eukprot:TRINITY_DN7119_c0_g1_i1.p1 TRINITY_DN7119_c0_g1~~TRINITY_DN7119_c0_g1_i1.p1  ORF type:complete len:103 (+),score=19.15 TRINITY_DN7119_c0_g1_i1:31-339(+)